MAASGADITITESPLLSAADTIIIAYSGGLDSTVLLHVAAGMFPAGKLKAVHINHGLSDNSDQWQSHCENWCRKLSVPLISRRVRVASGGGGLERAARDARYQVFEEIVAAGEVLLMAHHLDDQAETILYRLLRGAGPRGLAGIPVSRALAAGTLYRPFLGYSKTRLEAYARRHELPWIHDESNDTTNFDRNYLRREILPAIEKRWPDYRRRLLRSAGQCAKSDAVLMSVAGEDLASAGLRRERLGASIDLAGYLALSPERQQSLLREWVREEGYAAPTPAVHGAIASDLVAARRDASPIVSWPGGRFGRYRGRLYLLPPRQNECLSGPLVARLDGATPLPQGMTLSFVSSTGPSALRLGRDATLEIGFRRGGERCRPAGRNHSAPLKKLLQTSSLEPWLRDDAPLIFAGGSLAAVGDLFVCTEFACGEGERGYAPVWR